MDDLSGLPELRARTEQNRLHFLRTHLALCFTFAEVVNTELGFGERQAAQQAFGKAEQGYATIARFLPEVQTLGQRKELERRLAELRAVLDGLRPELQR